jgi:hypothetical protein
MITARIYMSLIGLGVVAALAGIYFQNWLLAAGGAGLALFFFSLELGLIIDQYMGLAKLTEIHNNLLIGLIRAQGYEIEGIGPETPAPVVQELLRQQRPPGS